MGEGGPSVRIAFGSVRRRFSYEKSFLPGDTELADLIKEEWPDSLPDYYSKIFYGWGNMG